MKNIIPFFIVLLVSTFQSAGAVTTLSGCDGGDFGADCSLAELNSGGTIQIDDILFDNWNVSVVEGSLNLIRVTPIDDGSFDPGPGLLFTGPGVVSNTSVGFEMNYDVSNTGGAPKLTGYQLIMGFTQPIAPASGFAAMEITDNVLVDTLGSPLEIANPEPTVDQTTTSLSDLFTTCDNDNTVTCPSVPDPSLPKVISSDFAVTTNLDVSGGASGSFTSFTLTQRFSLFDPPPIVLTGCDGGDFGADCSLAELNGGGTVQINDILFHNWTVSVVEGSLNLIRVTPVGEGSFDPGPGLLFEGPGAALSDSIGFEMFYDVSAIGGTPKLTGYQLTIGFTQLIAPAGGFTAMQLSDNILNDTLGNDLLIANPEPTVDQGTPSLSDRFTTCDNDITVTCPSNPDPSLPNVISSGFTVSTNLDIGGNSSGSFTSFDLQQRFSLVVPPYAKGSSLCFPVKSQTGDIVILCL